jgi:hypothetical protein
VDFVIEWRRKLLAIEVKAGDSPTYRDTSALRLFLSEYGARALGGIVVHTGSHIQWLTDGVLAVPWWRIM